MSDLRMLTLERVKELLAVSHPEQSQRSFATTMDYRRVDQANGAALNALQAAMASGALPMARWSGSLEHAAPPENIKGYYPPERQVAWSEPIELRVGVFEDAEQGVRLWLVERVKDGAGGRVALWAGVGESEEWSYYRDLENIPNGMGYLATLADPDFVGRELARQQREILDQTARVGGSAGGPSRM